MNRRVAFSLVAIVCALSAQAKWEFKNGGSWGYVRYVDGDGKVQTSFDIDAAASTDDEVIITKQGGASVQPTALDFEEIENDIGKKIVQIGSIKPTKVVGKVKLGHIRRIVGGDAFMGCASITEFDAPELVEVGDSAQNGAFKGCSALQKVNFPKIEYLGSGAFTSCTNLSDLGTMWLTVKHIGSQVFQNLGCVLGDVYLSVATNVGQNAFRGCSITRFEAPVLETMGMYQFYQNSTITEVKLPALTNIAASCFYQCSALTNIELNSIVTLPANTFSQASGLKRLVLSDSIKDMPAGVFSNCTTPESIEPLFPKALETMGEGVYAGMKSLCSPVVFDCPNMTTIPAKTFQNCVLISNIVIKTPVTAIGDYAFQNIKHWASFTFHCDKPTLGTSWWTANNWEKIQGFLKIADKDCADSWLAATETTSKAQLYEQQKNKDEFDNPGARKTLGCFAFGNGAAWLMKDWPSGFMLLLR